MYYRSKCLCTCLDCYHIFPFVEKKQNRLLNDVSLGVLQWKPQSQLFSFSGGKMLLFSDGEKCCCYFSMQVYYTCQLNFIVPGDCTPGLPAEFHCAWRFDSRWTSLRLEDCTPSLPAELHCSVETVLLVYWWEKLITSWRNHRNPKYCNHSLWGSTWAQMNRTRFKLSFIAMWRPCSWSTGLLVYWSMRLSGSEQRTWVVVDGPGLESGS